jgi:hypothetical protein
MTNLALRFGVALFSVSLACRSAPPGAGPVSPAIPADAALPTGDVHDFDFLAGDWTLTNRRLKKRGVGSTEWDEFPATDHAVVVLGSVVNMDEVTFPTKGWAGVTVRTFDRAKKQWSIYWVNSKNGVLTPPEVGGFTGDRGEFFGEDDDDGRKVKVRYLWIKRGPDSAHWEQSFSYDEGRTWETNWVNDLTRVKAAK